jgi:hypothetical protein
MSDETPDQPPKKKGRDWAPILLACIIMGAFISVLEYLLRGEIHQSTRDIVLQMIETLKNITIMVVSYFVGTTAGSEEKTKMIAKAGAIDPH